jgi:hypothetical protein
MSLRVVCQLIRAVGGRDPDDGPLPGSGAFIGQIFTFVETFQASLLEAIVVGDRAANALTIAALAECTRVTELVYLLSRKQHITQYVREGERG